MKLGQREDFLSRMDFDTFKRQTQEDRIKLLVEKNKVMINKSDQIETFNRLIDDSNRRNESNGKINNSSNTSRTKSKRYNHEEWSDIYKERYD
jgi:competence protein ComGF